MVMELLIILDKPIASADHAALEHHLDRMVEILGAGSVISVVTIDLTLDNVAKEFLSRLGYRFCSSQIETGNGITS